MGLRQQTKAAYVILRINKTDKTNEQKKRPDNKNIEYFQIKRTSASYIFN